MMNFILTWMIALIGIKIYLVKKKINIGINNDIIAIILSLSIVSFLSFIQWILHLFLSIFI